MTNVILLGLTSLLTDIASEMTYPIIPLFLISTLGATPAALGLIEGIAESIAALVKILAGRLVDRSWRKKSLTIIGYAASVAGKALLPLAHTWGVVFAGRAADRLGKGIRTVPRDALIAESTDSKSRGKAFGLHRGMDTAGAVLGVVFALILLGQSGHDYVRIFVWSLVPAILGVVILAWVREPPRNGVRVITHPDFRWSALPPQLKKFFLVVLLFSLGNSSNAFLLLRASGNAGTSTVLLLYLTYNVSYMLFSYPAGRWSDRVGRKVVLATGYTLYGLVYVGFSLLSAGSPSWIPWVLFIVYGIYSGFTDGVEKALIADLAPGDLRGTALGIHAMVVGIGVLPASLLAGWLWEISGPGATFGAGGALGLIAAAGATLVLQRKR
jgi:MFS family permease